MGTYPTSATATIKKGATAFPLDVQVFDLDGVAVDLTTYTRIQFIMVTPVEGGTDVGKVDAAGSFVDKTLGKIRYTWLAADVDTAGDFVAEFRLRPNAVGPPDTSAILKIPTDSAILVRIIEDVEA